MGKPNPEAIRFTKTFDANSILLLKYITTGKAFTSAKFTATSGNGTGTTTMTYRTDRPVCDGDHPRGRWRHAPPKKSRSFYKTLAWKFIDANGVETSGLWDIPAGTFTPP